MSEPIVIAGAGPVGLALALGLARRGVRSIVLESKPELSRHSKAIVVLPRTLEVLHEWGLLPTFKERGEWVDQLSPVDQAGRAFIHIDFTGLRSASPAAGAVLLPQSDTEEILHEAAVASGLVDVRFGHELIAFDADESGARARVRSVGGQYVLETPYLCGCDGARSAVRESLGMHLDGTTFDAHAVLADVQIDDERDALPWPRVDLGRRGINFAVRFRAGYWRIVLAIPGAATFSEDHGEIGPEVVPQTVHRLIGPGPAKIVWSSGFRIHCRNAPHFRIGRVLLLGDAAHLNSPAGGQGMNAGIQDAHNLAWKLALALRAGDPETLLTSYEEERYDAITRSVDPATNRLTRYGIFAPAWLRRILIAIVALAIRSPVAARRLVSSFGMLSFRYDMSELIDRSGGKLLPDADLGDGLRLRSAVGNDGGLVELVQNGSKVCVGETTYDVSGSASQELSRAGGPYIAVRPDHVVAYSGGSREDAVGYLAKIMVKA